MIRQATEKDYEDIAILANQLWANSDLDELKQEFLNDLSSLENSIFLCYKDDKPVAFVDCRLRYDYVEGAKTTPVAYIEGIYVKEKYRNQGIARQLIENCEQWARKHGCHELASDCEINNNDSFNFHIKSGFKEVNRVISFLKEL